MKRSRRLTDESEEYDDEGEIDARKGKSEGMIESNDAAAKTEKKLMRERKRRGQLNEALDSMAALLFEIDSSVQSGQRKDGHSSVDRLSSTISNRVDLINSAVEILKRIHQENEMRKLMIAELTKTGAPSHSRPLQIDPIASAARNARSLLSPTDLSRMGLAQHQLEAESLMNTLRRNAEQQQLQHLQLLVAGRQVQRPNGLDPLVFQGTTPSLADRVLQSSRQHSGTLLERASSQQEDQQLLRSGLIEVDTLTRLREDQLLRDQLLRAGLIDEETIARYNNRHGQL